ncbi:MAG TPA: efflux RND transporter periplasmic adaptor subunit [Patescibacteria group bacterium]|nr:efflux RND transporter periplasmic adaptor subunit [Patescibacteria group bacterium]
MAESRRLGRFLWVAAILVVVLGAGWYLVRRRSDDHQARYRTQAVDRGSVTMTVTATGTISAVTTVQVGSQVSGIIARLYADFNSPVKKDQLLAELDPTPFEAQVEQRKADLLQSEIQMRNAEITFHRQERLLADKLASQADYDAAKASYDGTKAQVAQTQATLHQAETNLRYTKILSPIAGVVVDRKYDIGQTVAASFQAPTLFTIAQDLTKMQVQADVDQSDIGRVAVGQAARFSVDAYPDEEFHGRIAQIRLNATVNQNIITYPVILEVPNPEEKLRPQMTANVVVEVAEVKDVLRIPNSALRFRPTDAAAGGDPARASGGDRAAGGAAAGGGGAGGAGAGAAGAEERLARVRAGGAAGAAGALDPATGADLKVKPMQTIYVEDGRGGLKTVSIRTGISDGRFTQVVEGPLQIGDPVVIGQATAKVDTSTRPPGGRMF